MSSAKISVLLDEPIATINPNLYGHFAEHLGACIYDGICVGANSKIPNINGVRTDVVEALKQIRPPVLRWPGGCFADDYHWRDGVGPRGSRPRTVNIHWGDSIETNEFGTHEFISFCRLIGAKPYLSGNVGSGSPREMRDWIEYCNFSGESSLAQQRAKNGSPEPFNVFYWGVGNENWGCGGHFCPEDYAAEYKRFSTYCHEFPGAPIHLIACGPDGNNLDWTQRFFSKLGGYRKIHSYSAHYYCGTAGTATEYTDDEWYFLLYKALAMETLIHQQRALLDRFHPERKIGLVIDEWGTWHFPTPGKNPKHLWQQNTLRDALVAAMTLDIFNRNAEKVKMANIAQTVNVLQALLLTNGESLVKTPTYHVYDMYQSHQGGQSLRVKFEADSLLFDYEKKSQLLPRLCGSASLKNRELTLSVVNPHISEGIEAAVDLGSFRASQLTLMELSHPDIHAHNTFEAPEILRPRTGNAILKGFELRHIFPPASVTVMRIQL